MEYRTLRPRPPLDRLVRCFWILSGGGPRPGEAAPFDRVLPDGCPEIVFHRGDPFVRRHWSERGPATQHRAACVGQLDRWIDIRPTGRVRILGVRLRPEAAGAVLGDDAARLTGRSEALAAVLGRAGASLEERVLAARTDADAVAAVEDAFLGLLARGAAPSPLARAAVDLLERSAGTRRVDDLAGDLGVSRRRLERVFASEVGLAPKRLARVLRFRRAVRILRDGGAGPAAAAADAGYFDQPHLHRDFLEFAGAPPARWAAGQGILAARFLG
jgi:AraC-like DNA-binding protein